MIKFRPHHFLCTVGFQGMGYSPEFIDNFQQIVDLLKGEGGDTVEIQVVNQTDDICAPCPEKRGKNCTSQLKIDRLDQAHAQVLNLSPGYKLTWGEAKKRIKESITVEVHHKICEPCPWRELGVCEKALKKLI